MYFKQSIGKLGEDIACLYLEKNNYWRKRCLKIL